MPELPEVESVRLGLEAHVLGARIDHVQVFRDSCVRRAPSPHAFAAAITGSRIEAVVRRGKFLWMLLDGLDLSGGALALSAHLGMSGQFRVAPVPAPAPHPHCRARFTLSLPDGPLTLDFLDQRTFGYLDAEPVVLTPDGLPGGLGSASPLVPASVAHIGRDALDPALRRTTVLAQWRKGYRGIKQVLLDQTLVSGIGNIYADEALWRARVHPATPASGMSGKATGALLDAAREVMSEALAAGGTSFDALYVNVNGESGYFDRELNAYGRGGEPCARCGRPMLRAVMGGRSTHWCPRCQRLRSR
ncbi:bifunctional DNA-formamidopyrimidine glycosylase/DNA-(apurinic or apyrimidinic site) lyase [Demequina sp.]|uniref:bifunctional DNA-formamidopyrimidine glycosylase/DNA-(apurinic or apyrimidinic site) lyase n=1 Tax=Demequina sp. TaxID=2050685 RepID=UPI003D10B882